MIDSLDGSMMSADQLYEAMPSREVTRPLFDDALSQAIDHRLLAHQIQEFHTSENDYIRVRVYFKP